MLLIKIIIHTAISSCLSSSTQPQLLNLSTPCTISLNLWTLAKDFCLCTPRQTFTLHRNAASPLLSDNFQRCWFEESGCVVSSLASPQLTNSHSWYACVNPFKFLCPRIKPHGIHQNIVHSHLSFDEELTEEVFHPFQVFHRTLFYLGGVKNLHPEPLDFQQAALC